MANKNVYDGEFQEGKKSGMGTFKWTDGRSYTGMWKENKRHGYGKSIDRSGQSTEGVWSNGEFVRQFESCKQ